jgi:hypothetical protein
VLFGIGLYTQYRWKLRTTSRGILTIATLLVPLNFLAIAAVSAGNTSGPIVIASELAAPAIFLCLVYFAGRVITPGCAHILSAGVLGSSVGQLLVRHFASLDAAPWLLIFLGGFPVACYVTTVGLALRVVLHVVSLMLVTGLGLKVLDQYSIWIVYGLYALGAFWLAWRRDAVQFTWIGSALLLGALALNFTPAGFAFPWQTAFFAHATICAAASIISSPR